MADTQPRITNAGTRAAAVYALMIGALVLLYLWIRSYGDTLDAPAPIGSNVFGSAASHATQGDLLHVLLALVVVIATARAMGWVFRSVNQPPVVGEILAGIVLGPSLLGRLAPVAEGYLFPAAVGPFLNIIAQVGVILYMFLVGLELDPALLRNRGHATVAISHASIVAAVPARRDDRALSLSPAVDRRRAVHVLLVVLGRVDVGDGVPGARENPDRSRHSQNPHGRDRADLRRRRTT